VPEATTLSPDAVADEPVSEAEQAVTVEHESVSVEVLAVVAPVGVKIENEVSHADVVILEQELLELVDDCDEDPDPLVLDADF